MAVDYLKAALDKDKVPQTEALDERQVKNSAGGFSYGVDDFTRFRRFIVLGAESGSYYAGERKLTVENVDAVKRAIKQDGLRAVKEIVEISDRGLAPKNDPALLALALCASADDPATRSAALAALPKVARIPTHLYHFATYVDSCRGWGRGLRTAVASWFNDKPVGNLAYQAVKYQQRDGWALSDLLRLSHPKATGNRNELYKYIVDGWPSIGSEPHPDKDLQIVWAAERAKTVDEKELVHLIEAYNLPMECVPTDKRTKAVYEVLIPSSGITWLLRNLGNLSKTGAIANGQYSNLNAVTERLLDIDQLKKGRAHPLSILVALNTYKSGHGVKGDAVWPVIPKIVDALDSAFYLAFDAVEPTGKRFMLAMDVSASMTWSTIAGMPGITPRTGAAALAMVTNAVEMNCMSMAFANKFMPVNLSSKERLDSLCDRIDRLPASGTDCAIPMLYAAQNNIEVDCFVTMTDSETWAGHIHPTQALKQYRDKTGIAARSVVVGMVSNGFTVADVTDPLQIDIVGFSADCPALISEFAAGRI